MSSSSHAKVISKMTPQQKLAAAERLYWSARELKAAGLRSQNPTWDEREVQSKVRELFLLHRDG